MAGQEFEAVLIKDDRTSGTSVIVPFDVQGTFGSKGQIKVKGTIDGHPYRGSIHPYGGAHYLGIRKELRDAIGKNTGDTVCIVMDLDIEPRTVEIPGDIQAALDKDEAVKARFEKLSYSHKKEYVEWINGAKKAETRGRRIMKALDMLVKGKS